MAQTAEAGLDMLTARISPRLKRQAVELSQELGDTLTQFVCDALEERIARAEDLRRDRARQLLEAAGPGGEADDAR